MDAYFVEADRCKLVDPLYETEFDISSPVSIQGKDQERLSLLENQVELFDISRRELISNDSFDMFNIWQMYKEMESKCSKALKANDALKQEALAAQSHIKFLEAEVRNLRGCKEELENQIEQLHLKKTLENIDQSVISFENLTLSHEAHVGQEILDCDPKLMKTFCNSKYLELQKETIDYDSTKECGLLAKEKGTQCSGNAYKDFSQWLGIRSRSSGTQTEMADNLNEISTLIDMLNDVKSKYRTLCLEKAMVERNLVHVANEKQVEAAKVLREREIRQKCLAKMEKLKEERDAAVGEYRLVMSERDVVHREINQLQDQLTEQTSKLEEAQKKIDLLERSQKTQTDCCTEEEEVMNEFDQILDESQIREDDFVTSPSSVYDSYADRGMFDRSSTADHLTAASVWMQNNFKENDTLKRQLQQTISEFAKRDRIVRERDSMRIMCDRLRQDRDNTVNELIKAKKESDEMKKQRNQAFSDLKTFQEMYGRSANAQSSREADEQISHSYSKDSAIDSDFQEWETELINLDIGLDNVGNLGFELAGGHKDGEVGQYVYVKNIVSCSPAYGVIQVNDQIMQVNNVDVTRADKSFVCQLIRQSPRPINMLIKRKKSCSKLYPATSQVMSTSSQQRSSKVDLPPRPPTAPQSAGQITRQQLRNTISCSTNHYRGTLEELRYQGNQESQKVCQEGEAGGSGGRDTVASSGDHLKVRKNILNKAFMALTKPFKNIPKDVRSKSNQPNISFLSKDDSWESKHTSQHETWPKCRSYQASSGIKKIRPRLNVDFTSKNVGTATESNHQDPVKDETKDQDTNASSKSLKTSFMYHYVQMSDPLSMVGTHHKDEQENDEPTNDHHETPQDVTSSTEKATSATNNSLTEQTDINRNIIASDSVASDKKIVGDELRISAFEPPLETERLENIVGPQVAEDVLSQSGMENNPLAFIKQSIHVDPVSRFPVQPVKFTHQDPVNISDNMQNFLTTNHTARKDETIWHDPPAHEFLRAVEERVSGVTQDHQQLLDLRKMKDYNSCVLHRCGTAGKMRKTCPNDAVDTCRKGGTRTLPHINSHNSNSRRFNDASIFSAYNQTSCIGSKVPHVPSANYGQPLAPGMFADRTPNSYFPEILSRMERHHLFHMTPGSSMASPPHTSSSVIPLNSNVLDMENSFSRPYQEFISPSKSDALLDVKQKLCRHLETDYGLLYQQEQAQKLLQQFETFNHGNFNILDSTSSTASSLRNVQISQDTSTSSLIQSLRKPVHRCPNKLSHTLPAMPRMSDSGLSHALTSVIHASQPNSTALLKDMPMNSFVDFHEDPSSFSIPGLYMLKMERMNSSVGSPATLLQRNSEPADFDLETVHGMMQVSSISDNGLTFNSSYQKVDPLAEMLEENPSRLHETPSDGFHEQPVDIGLPAVRPSEEDGQADRTSHLKPTPMDFTSGDVPDCPKGGDVQPTCLALFSGAAPSDSAAIENVVRTVVAEKSSSEPLKIRITGGNTVGIFVSDIFEGSVLGGVQGLRVGDQMLEFNGISMQNMLLEEAILELNRPCTWITCQVQYSLGVYERIQNQPCDSLYVRALFDQTPMGSGELSFSKGDVLFVDNTYYNNKMGVWWGYLINRDGLKTKCGTIISRMNRPAEGGNGGYFLDWRVAQSTGNSGGSIRRSFFKRRKHQTLHAREDDHNSEVSTVDAEIPASISEDEFYGLYERVEKMESYLSRPVLIVGTFANQIIAKLSKDFPYKFYRFIPEFGRRKSDVGSITYATETGGIASIPINLLKSSMATHHHSLMNFPLELVPKFLLHKIHLIVVLVKFKSCKQIKEAKDSHYFLERITTKQAREMYEASVAMERKFKHLINEIIPGGSLQTMCSTITEVVEREQAKPVWLTCSNSGAL